MRFASVALCTAIAFVGASSVTRASIGPQAAVPLLQAPSGSWSEKTFVDFDGNNGAYPAAPLVVGPDGALYGTANLGTGAAGYGTLYRISRTGSSWKMGVIHNFGSSQNDGIAPLAPVTFGPHGEMFGTTQNGGALCHSLFCIGGSVYEFVRTPGSPAWKETVIASFTATNAFGAAIVGPVIVDSSGAVYGTAQYAGRYNCGTVFRLKPTRSNGWRLSLLHSFVGGATDGCFPTGPLIRDRKGALYGTTIEGAASFSFDGWGCVYRLSPPVHGSGPWTETILHAFGSANNTSDGRQPWSGVTADSSGTVYGTTYEGGGTAACSYGCGTVFALKPLPGADVWRESIVYRFTGANGDGASPYAGLTHGPSGSFYGATSAGGSSQCGGVGCGTIYRLTASGSHQDQYGERLLYTFVDRSLGVEPNAVLLNGGALYGTTLGGGVACPLNPYGCGTIFTLGAQ